MVAISSLFWFLLAVLFACVEIEAEGKYGWAQNMPTWYRTRGFVARVFMLANAGKPLTGYHTVMFFIPLFMLHSPYVMGVEWTLARELMTVSLYFAWCPTWDYLWFVLNPAYGWRNFSRADVWWHAKDRWVLGLPLSYYVALAVSTGLAFGAGKCSGDDLLLINHLKMIALFVLFTVVTIILAPRYHRWYNKMRQYDDAPDRLEAGAPRP